MVTKALKGPGVAGARTLTEHLLREENSIWKSLLQGKCAEQPCLNIEAGGRLLSALQARSLFSDSWNGNAVIG